MTRIFKLPPLNLNSPQLEQLHNYFENRVLTALRARGLILDEDTFVDVACVALNELPTKYIRHDVDMAYFTDPADLVALHGKVERALDLALGRVLSKRWSTPE